MGRLRPALPGLLGLLALALREGGHVDVPIMLTAAAIALGIQMGCALGRVLVGITEKY